MVNTAFHTSDITYYQSDQDEHTFFYLPNQPGPVSNPLGKPQLMLLTMPTSAVLQLSSRWGADAAEIEALRAEITRQFNLPNPALIRLTPAPVEVAGAQLLIGSGQEDMEVLQTSNTSGFPPYTALFHANLTHEQAQQAVSALNGRTGFLQVRYQASQQEKRTATILLSGDVQADIDALDASASLEEYLNRIEAAIEEGRLQVQYEGDRDAPEELWQQAIEQSRRKLAALMQRAAAGEVHMDSTGVNVISSLTGQVTRPLQLVTDVSTWFSSGKGSDAVVVADVPTPSPRDNPPASPPSEISLRLNFDAAEAPLALVQVSSGSAQKTLSPPSYTPVTLPISEQTIHLKASYTTDGKAYEQALPTDHDLSLSPGDLGLALINIDASDRQAAGVQKVRVHLTYQPAGSGEGDERTCYFRNDHWQENWFLVTRSAELEGSIKVEWKETQADDAIVQYPVWVTRETQIRMEPDETDI